MAYRWTVMDAISSTRLVAVIRSESADEALRMGDALIGAGVTAVEVAFTTPNAVEAIHRLVSAHSEAIIGAGTVLDESTARLAILAGAQFVVSPSFSAPVVKTCHRYGVAVIPGVQTPNEMVAALEAGADAVKLFPADALGSSYLRAVLAALPQVPVIPTGGVSAATAAEWLNAGAVAVGIGGSLTSGTPQDAAHQAKDLLEALSRAT